MAATSRFGTFAPGYFKAMAAEMPSGLFATPDNIGELSKTTTTRRAPVVHPHLWLERCPTVNELHMARRTLARENRLPRDGKLLVCSIPVGDAELELRAMLDRLPFGRTFPSLEPLQYPEVAQVDGWSIVVRPEL